MSLSNQQLKLIKRLYSSKSPEDIGRELGLSAAAVYKALGLRHELYVLRIEKAAQYVVMLMLLCSPFLFIRGLSDFADLPQRVFLQTGVVLLGLLCCARALLSKNIIVVKGATPLLCVLFVLWICLSLLWAQSPFDARYAVVHWSCGPVLLFSMLCLVRTEDALGKMLYCLCAGLAGTVLLGLGQEFFGFRFVPQSLVPAAGFANPNVAAEYTALILPIALGVALSRRSRNVPVLLACGLTLGSIVYLICARCRSAWLALLCAGLWAAVCAIAPRIRGRLSLRWVLLLCAVAVVAAFGLFCTGTVGKVVRLAGGSAIYRTMVWENSLAMVQERPLLGFGPAGFKIFYPGYKNRAVPDKAFDKETQIRRAHNDYLQMAVETGVPGFLLFAGILLSGFAITLRHAGGAAEQPLVIGLSAGIIAFMTTAFFGFPFQRAVHPVVVFTCLALLNMLRGVRLVSVKVPRGIAIAALIIVCVAGAALTRFNVRTIISDGYFQTALRYEKGRANKKALEASLQAHAYSPQRMDILTTVGRAYVTTGDLDKGIQALEQVTAAQPYNLNALFILGAAYTNRGDSEKALATFRRVLQINPDFEEARQIVCGIKTRDAVRVNIL